MGYLEAVILGLVQGITEFLPISSDGHLALGHLLFQSTESSASQAFDVLVHGATLLVILHSFWDSFVLMLLRHRGLMVLIAAASLPTVYVGLCWRREFFALGESPWSLAACFAVTGLFLLAVRLFERGPAGGAHAGGQGPSASAADPLPSTALGLQQIGLRSALAVGLAQALAVAPGVSRSGLTISTGRLCGVTAEDAVRFSFLLGAPAIFGALVLESGAIWESTAAHPGPMAAGFLAALISGFLAVGLLKWLARRGAFSSLFPYCFALALLCVGLALVRG